MPGSTCRATAAFRCAGDGAATACVGGDIGAGGKGVGMGRRGETGSTAVVQRAWATASQRGAYGGAAAAAARGSVMEIVSTHTTSGRAAGRFPPVPLPGEGPDSGGAPGSPG